MKLNVLKNYFSDTLGNIYPKTEVDTFFFLLIEEYLGFQRIDTVLKAEFEIGKEQFIKFEAAITRLKKEEPIQYIIGKTEFYGLPFLVNENTLIPRPETEELVEWVIEEVKNLDNSKEIKILDIGTGTGCIPIALAKKLQNVHISAIDISKEALNTAKKNADLNKVSIHFIECNILKTEKLEETFDIIISNPPYVRNLEKAEIKNNVLDFEPHSALFVSDKRPLIFYDKIAELAKISLRKKGLLFFEINQYLPKETVMNIEKKGFKNVVLRKDLFGNYRMIKAEL